MELSELKRSKEMLLAVLDVDLSRSGVSKCPFHDDKTASLSVFQGKDGDAWLWKCFAGCGAGSIVDAALLKYNVRGPGEAIREIENRLGIKIGRDEDLVEPLINQDRAERLIAAAQKALEEDFDSQAKWIMGKRGFSSLETLRRFRVGFLPSVRFPEWHFPLNNCWVLPITDAAGTVKAVKLHLETMPFAKASKCWWAPFGTSVGGAKPKHGLQTLWPPPEMQPGSELYLFPGELKALVTISEGSIPATSITTGEGGVIADHLVERLRGRRMVFLTYDADKTGREWLQKMQEFLALKGVQCCPFASFPTRPSLREKMTIWFLRMRQYQAHCEPKSQE